MIDWSKIKLTDVTAKNARAFLEGTVNKHKYNNGTLDEDLVKMIESRIDKCPPCKAKGSCVECGCDFKGMISSPTKECPRGNWSKWITPTLDSTGYHNVDLSAKNVIKVKVANNTLSKVPIIITDISLSCDCMSITNQEFKAINHNEHAYVFIEFDTSRVDIGDERDIMITLKSLDDNSPLSKLETYSTYRIKRDK